MADNAVIFPHAVTGETLYFQIRDGTAKVWNGSSFETYDPLRWSYYDVAMVEQGSSGVYVGTFPAGISAGSYSVVCFCQTGGSPAEGDTRLGSGDKRWDSTEFVDVNDDVTAVKAVTDKLDDTVEDDGEGTYRLTTASLVNAPTGGDATAANQTTIAAAIAALNNIAAADVAAAVMASTVDGAVDVTAALKRIISYCFGKIVQTGSSPDVIKYYDEAGTGVVRTVTHDASPDLREAE